MTTSAQGLELRVPPLVVLAIAAFSMWLIARATPELIVIHPGRLIGTIALGLLGVIVAATGVFAFKRARTTVNPHTPESSASIVTDGIYGLTRNPMYLGMLLVLAGWMVYLANVAAAIVPVAFVAYITRYQIAPEERILAARFGAAYEAYLRSVRRWL